MVLQKGTKLGPYEILSKLGEGGMGEVFLAKDPRLERNVAIKVLPEDFSQNPQAVERFQYENKTIASLSHPNIRAIYDIGSDKGYTYAVMELLEGQTMARRLEQSALDWQKSGRYALSIARGLAAAHSKSIIHRDIKPQNIFITHDEEIKILDFGLALPKPIDSGGENEKFDSTLTQDKFAEGFSGTISYMSPEQVRSEKTDVRSDIFALGSLIYEMLTAKSLFQRKTPAETVAAILNDSPSSLAESGISIPVKLQRLLNLCLEKDPTHRIQSMNDIIAMLEEIETDASPKPKEAPEASVAVLPFANLSPDKENEYFSDGLTEELINFLVKIGGLHVASRTTSALFKGKTQDIRYIGEQLHVQTVVEGSVRKSGRKLRITAQLINIENGYHLWSDSFDREVEDVFNVQSEIAEHIAKALQVVLTAKEKRAIAKAPTENIKAYDYFLQGRQYFYHYQRKSFEIALNLFLHACERDPSFASAYAWASYCYSFLYTWFNASKTNLEEAEKTSHKALSLDKDLAEAHVSRGMVLSLKKKMSEAEKEFETALRLKPGLYETLYFYARLCFSQGKYQKAALLAKEATIQRPEDYSAPYLLGMIYSDLKQETNAQQAFQLCLQRAKDYLKLFPDDTRAILFGAGSLNHLGQREQALKWTERAFATSPKEPMTLYAMACDFAMAGNPEKAVSCLEKALLYGTIHQKWLENDPDLNSLRSHPRFQVLLHRLKDL